MKAVVIASAAAALAYASKAQFASEDDIRGTFANMRYAGARLEQVTSGSGTEPQQLHLWLTGRQGEMALTFVTSGLCLSPTVTYWPAGQPGQTSTVPADTSTYSAGIFGWSGWIHTAVMPGLVPTHKYTYTAGCANAPATVDQRTFSAAPVPGANETAYIAVLADMGTIAPMGWSVAEEVITEHTLSGKPFDMVVISGDLSYATIDPPRNEVEWTWDAWGIQNEPFTSTAPFMTTVGNHENVPGSITNSSGYFPTVEFASFTARYPMPSFSSGGYESFWFSYDYANIHFTSMSSEHNYTVGSPQWRWIEADLARADARRDVTPWLILMLHRPIYSSDEDEWSAHSPGCPLSVALEPLLRKYRVDLVIQGHMHCYERMQAVYNGTVITAADANNVYHSPEAPVYVLQGTSGAMQKETFVTPAPAWSVYRENGVFGFGRMTVTGASTLFYEFVSNEGVVQDSFTISK